MLHRDTPDRNAMTRSLMAGSGATPDQERVPVSPIAPHESGDIDLPCAHCGKLVFTGWNLGSLLNESPANCWNCGTESIEPRIFARIVALEEARALNVERRNFKR